MAEYNLEVLGDQFKIWLTGSDGGSFQYKTGGGHYTVIRVKKISDFDYLYFQRQYSGEGIERGDTFEYAGIYRKRDGLIYDSQYAIRDIAEDETRRDEALRAELKLSVREKVEALVQNDRRNLLITELPTRSESLSDFQNYGASGKARDEFLNSDTEDGGGFAFTYSCGYNPKAWTEDSLLAYILDPEKYSDDESATYFSGHQEDILTNFLQADMIAAAYKAIADNPQDPIHLVKRIMRAVNGSPAKTVTVSISKNGVPYTFKAEADQFRRDCVNYYNDWDIAGSYKQDFWALFGRNAHYGPEDIVQIGYGRSILYTK